MAKGLQVECTVLGEETLVIEDLQPETHYAVWITIGNAYPVYPDLLAEEDVVCLDAWTEPTAL